MQKREREQNEEKYYYNIILVNSIFFFISIFYFLVIHLLSLSAAIRIFYLLVVVIAIVLFTFWIQIDVYYMWHALNYCDNRILPIYSIDIIQRNKMVDFVVRVYIVYLTLFPSFYNFSTSKNIVIFIYIIQTHVYNTMYVISICSYIDYILIKRDHISYIIHILWWLVSISPSV